MIEKFSRLCRLGMKTGGNTITLREGIEHASIYLDVINFRHSEKIQLFLETEVAVSYTHLDVYKRQALLQLSGKQNRQQYHWCDGHNSKPHQSILFGSCIIAVSYTHLSPLPKTDHCNWYGRMW